MSRLYMMVTITDRNRKKKSDKIFCFLWIFSIMLLLERVLFL